mgnify:FL=1
MFVFFTIPAIFIIMMILIPLAIGASALQFILDHIVIISIIIWLPVAWIVSIMWRDRTDDEEKMEWAIYPLFMIPAYAGVIQLAVALLDKLDRDLFGFFLYILMSPVIVGVLIAIPMGIAWVLLQLYKKVIKSKLATIMLGVLIAALMTYYLWNLS